MTLDQIKSAVDQGRKVYWKNSAYEVIKDTLGQYLIMCKMSQAAIGLTWRDGVTLNGKPEDFYEP